MDDSYPVEGGYTTAGMLNQAGMAEKARYEKITIRENLEKQIEMARKRLEELEGIRDRMAPELLDQRISDLRTAMQF